MRVWWACVRSVMCERKRYDWIVVSACLGCDWDLRGFAKRQIMPYIGLMMGGGEVEWI